MSTNYKTIRYVGQDHPAGTPSLEDIVFAHADRNDYGNPTNIRWQELYNDLQKRGHWKKPAKGWKELMLDYNGSLGDVLLSDGTPAGLQLTWYRGVLKGAFLFDIPVQRFLEALDERLPIGTLLLPAGTEIAMRNEDGTRTKVVLFGLIREETYSPLLVNTELNGLKYISDARDLHISDIYQILRFVKGCPAGMPSLCEAGA